MHEENGFSRGPSKKFKTSDAVSFVFVSFSPPLCCRIGKSIYDSIYNKCHSKIFTCNDAYLHLSCISKSTNRGLCGSKVTLYHLFDEMESDK